MTYGKRLQQALEYAKKNRRELAAQLECSPQAIGIVITGAGKAERRLSTENHAKAAKFLRVDAQWLLSGDGEMIPSVFTPNQSLALVDVALSAMNNEAKLSETALLIAQAIDDLPSGDAKRKIIMACLKLIADGVAATRATSLPSPADAPKTSDAEPHTEPAARNT